jgi:nucleotide-binding universal stress UspA family protein
MTAAVIAHTTDLTGDDARAFEHACALAAASGARLLTVHGNAAAADVDRLPDARPLAAAWGRRIDHERRCHECCDDVADTVLDAVRRAAPALVVVGTHARHGLAAVLRGSVAEAIARNLDVPTLIVPNRVRGFVDPSTGAVDLRRVLVPVGGAADGERGVAAARALVALAGVADAEIIPFHVERGDVAAAVVAQAATTDACVIVMTTHGHDGIADSLVGSRTEHVLRDATCPVLSVPA